jgi:hypothetical protein
LPVHNDFNYMILFYIFSYFLMSGIPLHMAWILIKDSLENIRVRVFIIYRPY